MKCENVREALSAYLDEELDAAFGDQVTEHVRGCGECRKALARLGAVSNLFRDARQVRAPRSLAQRVAGSAGVPAVGAEAPPLLARLAALAAGALIYFGGAWVVDAGRTEGPVAERAPADPGPAAAADPFARHLRQAAPYLAQADDVLAQSVLWAHAPETRLMNKLLNPAENHR